ncbi:MAG: C39 family peptidase [Planctomycetes bacterium]|nr:C39 family peptidase [Planctomycetota bacterium]
MLHALILAAGALASPCQTPAPLLVPFVETRFATLNLASAGEIQRAKEGAGCILLAPSGPQLEREARFTTRPFTPAHPFRDLLVSWNVNVPKAAGFCVELRVARVSGEWSSWLWVGDWGTVPDVERVLETEGGKVDTDFFRGQTTFIAAEVRVRAWSTGNARGGELSLDKLTLCFSDRERRVEPRPIEPGPKAFRLPVPTRSQRAEAPQIADRICSPTSLAMVMAYRGASHPTADIAARAFDARHDIYGNWPRNVQAAYTYGVPGYITRIASWSEAEELIRARQPIIASIAVKIGELPGAPYAQSAGHLLVITGFDAADGVQVNDPAASDPEPGRLVYKRADLERCWLERGGTAYILEARP